MRCVVEVDSDCLFIYELNAFDSNLCELLLDARTLFLISNGHLIDAIKLFWLVDLGRYYLIKAHCLVFL